MFNLSQEGKILKTTEIQEEALSADYLQSQIDFHQNIVNKLTAELNELKAFEKGLTKSQKALLSEARGEAKIL